MSESVIRIIDGKTIGVLSIQAAAGQTVTFQKTEYIRVGSYTKKLQDVPAIRAKLWDKIRNVNFKSRLSLIDLSLAEAMQKIGCGHVICMHVYNRLSTNN